MEATGKGGELSCGPWQVRIGGPAAHLYSQLHLGSPGRGF